MQESTARQKVLKNIRNALIADSGNDYAEFASNEIRTEREENEAAEILFARSFTAAGGHFIFCGNVEELADSLTSLLADRKRDEVFFSIKNPENFGLEISENIEAGIDNAVVGISGCDALIASTGSILLSSSTSEEHLICSRPEEHIVLALSSQIYDNLSRLSSELAGDKKMQDYTTLITGPSRTADIEKTIVMGMHGPKKLYLFLLDDLQDYEK